MNPILNSSQINIQINEQQNETALNFSFSALTQPPDLSFYPNLIHLNLSDNQLTNLPDLSYTPKLQYLDLSDNQFTIAPDLSFVPNLRTLYLHNCPLTEAPDFSHTPHLEFLSLAGACLTHPPDFSSVPNLEVLDLYGTGLTEAPDLSHTPNLRKLDLSGNQFTIAPDLSSIPQLETLDLYGTGLTETPDLSHTPNLRKLDLARNQFTIAPDVSSTPHLERLDLSGNPITELHDSILSLPNTCTVNIERTDLTNEYFMQFRARLHQHAAEHPGQGPILHFSLQDENPSDAIIPLDQSIDSWRQEFEEHFREEPLEDWNLHQAADSSAQQHFATLLSSLNPETQRMLSRYLKRLKGTRDYTIGGEAKKNMILRVERMLQLANQNENFRNAVVALLQEGLTSCHDRVAIVFNEIEILWRFHQQHILDDLEQFCGLCIRAERYERVKRYAQERCVEHNLGDEIETILYFHLHLKDFFNLPITMTHMLYPGCSGVTEEMLETAQHQLVEITEDELLSTSPHWQEKMKSLYPEESSHIEEKYEELLEDLTEYDHCSPDDREAFLGSHPFLETFFEGAKAENIEPHYNAFVRFIVREKEREIAHLYSL